MLPEAEEFGAVAAGAAWSPYLIRGNEYIRHTLDVAGGVDTQGVFPQ